MIDLLQILVEKINDAELYHEDGLLLGTFSDVEWKGYKLILGYFENLFITSILF